MYLSDKNSQHCSRAFPKNTTVAEEPILRDLKPSYVIARFYWLLEFLVLVLSLKSWSRYFLHTVDK